MLEYIKVFFYKMIDSTLTYFVSDIILWLIFILFLFNFIKAYKKYKSNKLNTLKNIHKVNQDKNTIIIILLNSINYQHSVTSQIIEKIHERYSSFHIKIIDFNKDDRKDYIDENNFTYINIYNFTKHRSILWQLNFTGLKSIFIIDPIDLYIKDVLNKSYEVIDDSIERLKKFSVFFNFLLKNISFAIDITYLVNNYKILDNEDIVEDIFIRIMLKSEYQFKKFYLLSIIGEYMINGKDWFRLFFQDLKDI